mmetsp:Transcript_66640/g.192508  ORF Transcript_66640/g.192508 Transcript_66640/m.192508 type:complete len:561 (-) Transcript_66640:391-2073(-)
MQRGQGAQAARAAQRHVPPCGRRRRRGSRRGGGPRVVNLRGSCGGLLQQLQHSVVTGALRESFGGVALRILQVRQRATGQEVRRTLVVAHGGAQVERGPAESSGCCVEVGATLQESCEELVVRQRSADLQACPRFLHACPRCRALLVLLLRCLAVLAAALDADGGPHRRAAPGEVRICVRIEEAQCDVFLAHEARLVQGRTPLLVQDIDATSAGDDGLQRFDLAAEHGMEQRRATGAVHRVDHSATLEQLVGRLGVPAGQGVHQGGATGLVRERGVGFVLEKHRHAVSVAPLRREHQRRGRVLRLRVRRGLALEQPLHERSVAPQRCEVQGADTPPVLGADTGLRLRQQVQNLVAAAGEDCREERRQACCVAPVRIRLGLDQLVHEREVALPARELQGGLVPGVRDVDLNLAQLEEGMNNLAVAALHRMVQDRVAVRIEEGLLAVGKALLRPRMSGQEGLHGREVALAARRDEVLRAEVTFLRRALRRHRLAGLVGLLDRVFSCLGGGLDWRRRRLWRLLRPPRLPHELLDLVIVVIQLLGLRRGPWSAGLRQRRSPLHR